MAAVKTTFRSTHSSASFEGVVEPNGATGYKFSGTLKASCGLDRRSMEFANAVRLGHGGTSGDYSYLEFTIEGNDFTVKGEGTRERNETVDFRVGVNDGLSGQFDDGDKTTVIPGGPAQRITPSYITKDGLGNTKYDVRFEGTARADGPTGYVIQGTLTAYSGPGALSTQYAAFGYKNASGSWQYKTYDCDDTPQDLTVRGQRKSGENIRVVVGATSKVLNLYGYGDEVNSVLPEAF